MKSLSSAFAIVLVFALSSCRESNETTNNIPSPVQSDGEASILPTKRYPQTMLEEIYGIASSKNPELQKLNTEIYSYNSETRDSLAGVDKYLEYSTTYYEEGDNLLNSVKDSLLKKRLQTLITKSENRYKKVTGKLTSLRSIINKSEASIDDYHLALKLIVTLPIIEKYQNENLAVATGKINKVVNKGEKLKQKTKQTAERYEKKLN